MHAWGLRLRRVAVHWHLFAHCVLSFRLAGHRRHPVSAISELNTQPAYTPVQRFKCSLATALAWLGVRMVATPFLCDSFIHYSTPVYPDAIPAGGLLHGGLLAAECAWGLPRLPWQILLQ